MGSATQAVRMHRARITRQGPIPVPKSVRDALEARPGDDVEFIPRGSEMLVKIRRRPSVLDFAGIASQRAAHIPNTAEALAELIESGMIDTATSVSRAGIPPPRRRR